MTRTTSLTPVEIDSAILSLGKIIIEAKKANHMELARLYHTHGQELLSDSRERGTIDSLTYHYYRFYLHDLLFGVPKMRKKVIA
ncbi:MAG: hypothetical protein IJ561_02350 [Ruminococcus sp.]|nr:hypothetical protein [Ruminococcus sp.]